MGAWGPTPPVRGRWPKARGDRVRWPRRGRMRGQVSDCICCTQGSFAACGRRVSFPAMGKKPKDRRGTAQDGHCVSIFAYPTPSVASRHLPLTGGVGPRTPVTGVTPCSGQNISGAQKQECLGAVPSGPLGPGFTKIGTGAVPHLRLSLPSQRSRPGSRRRGGPMWPPVSLPL